MSFRALTVAFFTLSFLQPADPKWESVQIKEPTIESHLKDDTIMPVLNIPGRRYITSFDPSTGLHIGTFLADNEQEIESKIKRAAEAQKKWKHTTFQQRRRVVRSLLKWLVENQDVCARVACRDTGKTCECLGNALRLLVDLKIDFSCSQ